MKVTRRNGECSEIVVSNPGEEFAVLISSRFFLCRVLMCESTPRCCCLSPSKATLAFAGLVGLFSITLCKRNGIRLTPIFRWWYMGFLNTSIIEGD